MNRRDPVRAFAKFADLSTLRSDPAVVVDVQGRKAHRRKGGRCKSAPAGSGTGRAREPKRGQVGWIVEAGPREPRRTGMAAGPLNSTGVATFAREVHAFAGRTEVSP